MSKKRQPSTTGKPRSTTRIDDSDLYAPGRYLPECDGPKLGLFKDYRANIEWCEMLGPAEDPNDSDDTDPGTADGYVFRAIINSKQYAIKVFKFYDPRNGSGFWKPLLGKTASLIQVGWFSDPFYSECRAYGKMQASETERRKSARIAVPCHGYILLRQKDAELLRRRGIDLDIANLDYQRQTTEKCKVRAIVKDLASPQSGVNKSSLRRIENGIRYLNTQGILNADIREDNFRDSRLVDFGSSWTEPHAMLDAMDQDERRKWWKQDRLSLNLLKRKFDVPIDKPKMHAMKRRSQVDTS